MFVISHEIGSINDSKPYCTKLIFEETRFDSPVQNVNGYDNQFSFPDTAECTTKLAELTIISKNQSMFNA